MNEPQRAEWLPEVQAAVAKYSGATAEAQETVCEHIGALHGPMAAAKARELLGLGPKAEKIEERLSERAVREARSAKRAREEEAKAASFKNPEIQPSIEAEAKPRIMLPAIVPPPPVPACDEAIVAMNKQHAIIDSVGGKTVIASWEPSAIDPERLEVVFQNKESFLLRYSNQYQYVDVPDGQGRARSAAVPLGQWWLRHRDRQQYRGITFLPAGPQVVNGCLNLWQGWGVEAKPGHCELIIGHIEEVVASGNREFADYVIRWIAWAIQHPEEQAEVALVLIGEKGTGKGTLGRCLQRIFGAHARQVTSQEEVIGKFNGHLQDCVLFIADEAYWGGDKRCVGRLQGMITETTLPIERKGIDLFQVKNRLHVMMLAEPGWVIPAGRHERRYAALEVSSARRGDKDYFRALHQQIDNGGAEALFWEFGRMELGDWHPRDIPKALLNGNALRKQQRQTLPPLWQWLMAVLHDGVLPGALGNRPNTAWTWGLIENAKEREPRLKYNLTEVALRNFLVDEIGCTKYRTAGANGWAFPLLTDVRSKFEEQYGVVKWDTEATEWRGK